MSRSEQFFAACTTLPFPEVRDKRGEDSLPELERVSDLVSEGRPIDAIEYGKGLARHYPDVDSIPVIIATLLIETDKAEEVVALVSEAIHNCPRKYRLYSVAGQAELALDNLVNALVWWSRSVIAQCQVIEYQERPPFFHLAHAALVLGARREAKALFAMSSAIDPAAPHLSPDLEDRLEPLATMWAAEPLRQVLTHIEATYLHSVG